MANPVLNDKTFGEAVTRDGATWSPPPADAGWQPPIDDGPTSPWQTASADRMTVRGSIFASVVLFALLLFSASFGWAAVEQPAPGEAVEFPGIALLGVVVGFVAVLVACFKPKLARILGPIYALAQGYAVGAISKAYELQWDGIVLQAVGATLGVFAVMLLLYQTRIIRVTDRLRRTVIMATLGVMVFYLVSFIMNLFTDVSFLQSNSLLSIGFSVLVAGLAAFNLMLDFDFIERGARANVPKHMDWLAALGLLVTLVWLYLEILRLLGKVRSR
jgi:uncharacterized YccA/Bax inhibitor family protein